MVFVFSYPENRMDGCSVDNCPEYGILRNAYFKVQFYPPDFLC
jgi:hypothetical protein